MRKFYPNFKVALGLLGMGLIILIPCSIVVFFMDANFWLYFGVLIALWLINIIFFIKLATLSIGIEETYLLYQKTCFSKAKRILLKDIKKIVLNYRGSSKSLDIIHTSGKIFFDIDICLVKALVLLYPEELFQVDFLYAVSVPKKHREFLLSTDLLDKKQRKKLS